MKKTSTIVLFLFLHSYVFSQTKLDKQSTKLDAYFQKLLSDKPDQPVVNILCLLENKKEKYRFHRGYGQIDLESKEPVVKEQPFKIASITKMFTSVVILQMHEEGLIDIDKPVIHYLKDIDYLDFETLHVFEGDSYGHIFTARQLLRHRSGLADMFEDTRKEFDRYVKDNRQKQWSPKLLFEKYYDLKVNTMAKFKPGESYAYTDVGYFLLDLCIQEITKKTLAENYRTRIISPLNLTDTFFEYYEEYTNKLPLAHAYVDDFDATKELNTSFDWAGGGLVSTTLDLTKFIQGLFDNRLFKQKGTLESMIDDKMYGFGISVFEINKKIFYGHLGFWGSGIFYAPENKITLSISINQSNPPFNAFKMIKKIVKIID